MIRSFLLLLQQRYRPDLRTALRRTVTLYLSLWASCGAVPVPPCTPRHLYILYSRGRAWCADEETLRGAAAFPLIPTFSPRRRRRQPHLSLWRGRASARVRRLCAALPRLPSSQPSPPGRRRRQPHLSLWRGRASAGEETLRGAAASPLIPTFSPREKAPATSPLLVERSCVCAGEETLRGNAASPLIPTFSPREKASDRARQLDSPCNGRLERLVVRVTVATLFGERDGRLQRGIKIVIACGFNDSCRKMLAVRGQFNRAGRVASLDKVLSHLQV